MPSSVRSVLTLSDANGCVTQNVIYYLGMCSDFYVHIYFLLAPVICMYFFETTWISSDIFTESLFTAELTRSHVEFNNRMDSLSMGCGFF